MKDCLALISTMRRDYVVELVESRPMLHAVQRLRYQVYHTERAHHDVGRDGVESDDFDDHAHHVVLRRRSEGEILGTVRIVTGQGKGRWLPMHEYCRPSSLGNLPSGSTGEVSRFVLSRDRRSPDERSELLLRLALLQGIMRVSAELRLTHWCALMERSLLRLLRAAGVHFEPVGAMVQCHGLRQPAVGMVQIILETCRRVRPEIWDYVTLSGDLDYAMEPELVAA